MPRYDVERDPRLLPRLLRPERPPDRGQLAARAGQRPDAAVHERGHEPVQGHVPGQGASRLPPGHQLAEVHAHQRQAQRPRERRAIAPPPHVLRDAGQLLVRRLLQEGGDPVRLGAPHRRLGAPARPPARHGVRGRRRGAARRGGLRDLAAAAAGGADQRTRRGQFLADGRYGAVRTLLGGPLLPRQPPALRQAGVPRRRLRLRPVRRDLEQRVHGVRPPARRHAQPAACPIDRHRHGPRADHRGPAGRAVQLRHRPVHAAAVRDRRDCRHDVREQHVADRRVDAGGRRPCAGDGVLHRRRRGALHQGAGLRTAPDHAPRDASREAARHPGAVLPSPG